MTRHIEEGELHDFREGLLNRGEEERVRDHLKGCPVCRAGLERLSSLSEDLGSLPLAAEPSRDLWPQIAWRMADSSSSSADLDKRRGRRVSMPAWQLLAASVTLMVISGATVWTFLSGSPDPVNLADPLPQTPAQFVGWEESYSGYDDAVADLENVLEQGRQVLDPETVKVLEESLQTIDRAIDEAGEAVSQDPASTVLRRFLADSLRKKMDLLRKAAMAVYAIT